MIPNNLLQHPMSGISLGSLAIPYAVMGDLTFQIGLKVFNVMKQFLTS